MHTFANWVVADATAGGGANSACKYGRRTPTLPPSNSGYAAAAAGVICHAKPGEHVVTGQPIVELRGDDPTRLEAAQAELARAIEICDDPPSTRPLVLERIGF